MGPGGALLQGPGPQGLGGEVPPEAGGGAGCRRLHGKPCCPMRSIPRESTPKTSPQAGTTHMSSDACPRPSRTCGEKEGACWASPQAQPHAHTHPRHPASVDARTPAAPVPPQPTAPRKLQAQHNMTRLTPQPAAPPANPKGEHSLGSTQAAGRRCFLPRQPSNPRTRAIPADNSDPACRLSRPGADSA